MDALKAAWQNEKASLTQIGELMEQIETLRIESDLEIVKKRETKGLTSPLFFQRVGYEAYLWKGGRR